MVTIFTDTRMLEHRPPRTHPERPERLQAILRHLSRIGIMNTSPLGSVRPASNEEISLVHSPHLLDQVARAEAAGVEQIESDTWLSEGSVESALLAAGASVCAVNSVLDSSRKVAACLVRPPGHHATPSHSMGFCLFNNIAIGAAHAVKNRGLDRVLIVDFDVHHGNGTQDIFFEDPNVAFLSIHRSPFYPGTGAADETGTGPGLGRIKNIPLHYGTSRTEYLDQFRLGLEALADKIRPQLVMISAGFDAHAEDPVGDLGLDTEDYEAITKAIVQVAEVHSEGRIVSVLEGGYNVPILAGCVALHLETLGAEPLPPGSR
jgi:acetoin utilization deacetylase AcuC-like enzyme